MRITARLTIDVIYELPNSATPQDVTRAKTGIESTLLAVPGLAFANDDLSGESTGDVLRFNPTVTFPEK